MSLRVLGTICLLSGMAFGQTPAPLPPIDAHERVHWLVVENLAPAGLLDTLAVAAIQTAANAPKEYGPHWMGFAKRSGLITANYAVKSTMEAGLGAMWGEDPRYDQTEGKPFGARVGHVISRTFMARNRAGKTMPAYARFLAIPGSAFLYNEWIPDSQATANQAVALTGLGFLSRMGENAWNEFIHRRK